MYLYKYGYNCMRIANCFYLNVVLVVFCNYYIYNVKHNDGNNDLIMNDGIERVKANARKLKRYFRRYV